jgi:cysteine sulfinate desulfinase/cysteine desulfurase-like protein
VTHRTVRPQARRVSVGPETTRQDADAFLAAYADAVARLRTAVGRSVRVGGATWGAGS